MRYVGYVAQVIVANVLSILVAFGFAKSAGRIPFWPVVAAVIACHLLAAAAMWKMAHRKNRSGAWALWAVSNVFCIVAAVVLAVIPAVITDEAADSQEDSAP